MRLYLISNARKFKGAVHVVYDVDGRLLKVDFSATDLDALKVEQMLKLISGAESAVGVNFKNADTIIVQGDFELTFEDFMREYIYKRNTHLAREYWPKMKKEDQVQAYVAATAYRKYCEREKGWYKPMIADTWLKKKEYLNDWKNL
jgi:hypothetical protein